MACGNSSGRMGSRFSCTGSLAAAVDEDGRCFELACNGNGAGEVDGPPVGGPELPVPGSLFLVGRDLLGTTCGYNRFRKHFPFLKRFGALARSWPCCSYPRGMAVACAAAIADAKRRAAGGIPAALTATKD